MKGTETAGLLKRLLEHLNSGKLEAALHETPNGGEPCRIVSYGLRPLRLDEIDRIRRSNRSPQARARARAANKAAGRARRMNRR